MKSIPLLLLAATATPAFARSAESDIRALRTESNAAIAAHDFAAMRRHYLPDFTVLPGSSGLPSSLDQFAVRIGQGFADPTFATYVRTPTRIVIGASGKRAAETGNWVGTWRKPDGIMRLSGIYQAMWIPTAAGWRLRNESFVSLRGTGSVACGTVD